MCIYWKLLTDFSYALEHCGGYTHRRGDMILQGDYLMRALVLRFVDDQSGATAIEYGLIAAGISIAIIAVVNGLGTNLNTVFGSVSSQLN